MIKFNYYYFLVVQFDSANFDVVLVCEVDVLRTLVEGKTLAEGGGGVVLVVVVTSDGGLPHA